MHIIPKPRRFRRRGWIVLATILVAIILALSTGAALSGLHAQMQPRYQSAVGTPVYIPTPTPTRGTDAGSDQLLPSPISGPASTAAPPSLPLDQGIVYATGGAIYLLSSSDAEPIKLTTPGYTSLVRPILTNDGHLLYAATDGLYLIDLINSDTVPPLQITSIDPKQQVIASMTLSADGHTIFWTVEPHNGNGAIELYKSTLTAASVTVPTLLYSQPTNTCPCYMVFGLAETGKAGAASGASDGSSSLLVTDNLGTPADQGTGLWVFDQTQQNIGTNLLTEDEGQAPLALSPDHTMLAYAPTTGEVPEPTDSSIPAQVGSQPFGNSLAVVNTNANGVTKPVTIVPPQANIHSFSAYHWITTPVFSADNKTLAYIQFSSDDVGPYDRHSTLYIASTDGSRPPQVVANFSARLVELGTWLDSHTLLLYADKGIYAIDTQTAAISLLAAVPDYSRIVGLVQVPNSPGNVNCSHAHTVCAP